MRNHSISHKFLMTVLPILMVVFLSSCSDKTIKNSNPLQGLSDSSGKYEKPSKIEGFNFPEAHAPHKSFQQEWWYLTANLTTENGQTLATQWTLFRRAVEDKHWYFAHAALANAKEHVSAFREGREALGTVNIKTQPFMANIDDWRWHSSASLLPAQLSYGEHAWQVNLNLSNEQQFFRQGENGFSQKHSRLDIASYYYSQPFIEVSGEVFWQGKWQNVTGKAWLDREWGSQMLAPDQQGWDWFSLRLNQELALMVYRIRSNDIDYLYGSLMNRNGEIRTLSADEITLKSQSSIDLADSIYPQTFSISIEEEQIDITVNVVNKNQIMRFGIEYFEGMVTFSGSHQGQGFLEMTGYKY